MTSTHCWRIARPFAVTALLCPLFSFAQSSQVLSVAPPERLVARRGETVKSTLRVELRSGYHVNSNTPGDEYLIPLRLLWEAAPLEVSAIAFPRPRVEKYEFSDKPMSVYTEDFEIATTLKTPASAPLGPKILLGKLRYQACNDRMCLPPRSIEIKLPVDVR